MNLGAEGARTPRMLTNLRANCPFSSLHSAAFLYVWVPLKVCGPNYLNASYTLDLRAVKSQNVPYSLAAFSFWQR